MRILLRFACMLVFLSACSAEQPPLTASSLRLAAPMPGMSMGAAYLELHNNSAQDIRVTRVASPQLESVEMHETILADDISRMVRLAQVVVPAGDSLAFEPGAKHLMVHYPANRESPITLNFFADDALLLSVRADIQD